MPSRAFLSILSLLIGCPGGQLAWKDRLHINVGCLGRLSWWCSSRRGRVEFSHKILRDFVVLNSLCPEIHAGPRSVQACVF
ncbi:hypothetical protein Pcinc_026386 [Petrolisthes cinctipes]|uniref:Secreted protein n=1 Tax=Petrolisthes cinctipes TaxID=88211 RepID=A0AAE1F6K3_PETCI|nr:hypothetical protein Pcinc_026386 [Petrolisthes cinctipes]